MTGSQNNGSEASDLNDENRQTLLVVARDSIGCGLRLGRCLPVDPTAYTPPLRRPGATFVTLRIHDKLRGCIGSLEAVRPLVADVAEHAYGAAFSDSRFPRLSAAEFERLCCHISILDRPQRMAFDSEEQLISQLRPGVDGLILEDGTCRGTFLPSVWEQLPQPRRFLAQLKVKAGLSEDAWSDTMSVSRYTVDSIEE